MDVHIKTAQMLQKYGKWPVFSFPGSEGEAAALWELGLGFTKFYEYFVPTPQFILELYNDTARNVVTMAHAPTAVKRHPAVPFNASVAAFLVATGGAPYSTFQYSAADWVVDKSWQWHPLYDYEFGSATGPLQQTPFGINGTGGTLFERTFSSGAVVSLNCTNGVAWCSSNFKL